MTTSQTRNTIHSAQKMNISKHRSRRNAPLAEALSRLSEQEREMLYLSFFKRMPQHEIARRYQCCRSTAGYHIRRAIGRLYEEMEGMAHEE